VRAGTSFEVVPVGWVESPLTDRAQAPRQADEGAPAAWLAFEAGVFSTRSPDRPNPVGLHRVSVIAVDGLRVQVGGLEALDGTPVIDVKPVLDRAAER
jgi:tRNA (Thr-GGU) A37 N-methylase